ncbi:hypothetical protein [Paraliomyxa miuraensis]|uniref:hypothetical protein n=1 Tax=Paraliomyxa miuraensis TaxID=376150 RepID=UPI00225A2235|nr:hypothetical protein [Paraliomyxa miuraensis]MCX4239477.1 hypothetical protein [Paraliomyxa miuraensis]
MYTFSRIFARTLAILVVATNVAGCDEPPVDDGFDELEFRDGELGEAPSPSIIEIVKRPPLYPASYYDKGGSIPWDSPWIHSGYDPVSGGHTDVTGHTVYAFDDNDLLPFGTSDVALSFPACDAFLLEHDGVPIAPSGNLGYCAAQEQGCCDFICKAWGAEVDPQNRVDFVDQDVMDIEPIHLTYVPEFLSWDSEDPNGNGGLGRAKACSCNCTTS